jgi:hypothetical protein
MLARCVDHDEDGEGRRLIFPKLRGLLRYGMVEAPLPVGVS